MTLKRITITVKSDVLKRIDMSIDKKNTRNRSHAIEQLIMKALSKTDLNTAIIMAGGEGADLRPITYEIPKALIPINGRPILEHQINLLKKFDIRNIIVTVGHLGEKITEEFGNGSKYGVNISYIKESTPLGTIGSIKQAKDIVKDTFLVLNVDTLMDPDIPKIYDFHKQQGKLATLMLTTSRDTSKYGVARMKGSQIVDFISRPHAEKTPSMLINAGLAIFEKSITDYIPKKRFMAEELYKKLAKEDQIAGFVHDGYMFDVGTKEGYERAIKAMKSEN